MVLEALSSFWAKISSLNFLTLSSENSLECYTVWRTRPLGTRCKKRRRKIWDELSRWTWLIFAQDSQKTEHPLIQTWFSTLRTNFSRKSPRSFSIENFTGFQMAQTRNQENQFSAQKKIPFSKLFLRLKIQNMDRSGRGDKENVPNSSKKLKTRSAPWAKV